MDAVTTALWVARAHFARASIVGVLALMLSHTYAQVIAPRAMPNVRVERALATDPVAITPYQPFDVIATFSKPYCLSTESPLYSALSLVQGELRIVLSHVKEGPCVTERRLRIPGLGRGDYRIRVSITDNFFFSATYEAEVGVTTFSVSANASTPMTERIRTARIDGGAIVQPYGRYDLGAGPVTLVELSAGLFAPLGTTGVLVDLDGTYTFGAFFKPRSSDYVAPAFVPLYSVVYPAPYLGRYVTTSLETARRLRATWAPTQTGDPQILVYVLRLENAACPIGASPVYQLFNPSAVAHRWTQSLDLYAVLSQSGFVGEGAVFCAPKQD